MPGSPPCPPVVDDLPLPAEGEDLDAFEFRGAVDALARHLLSSRREAVARLNTIVSLEAEWGWGKTTFANLLVGRLTALLGEERPRGSDPGLLPLRIDYNAWLSGPQDGSHWASIAARIGRAFYLDLQQRLLAIAGDGDGPVPVTLGHPAAEGDELPLRVPDRAQILDPRTRWTDIAWQLSEAVPGDRWDPCFALFTDAPSKLPGRGFSGREAARSLARVASGALQAVARQDGAALLGTATTAAGELASAHRDASAPAAPESDEFVAHLGTLMRVLRPRVRGWRAILVLEDVARLDDRSLSDLLEALSYLRHLPGVLVLICVDRGIADRVLIERPGDGGEGRLAKTIDIRQRVPPATWTHRTALIGAWCGSLGMPAPDATARSLGRWCFEHGQHSPRQIKRLLRWLDVRLRGLAPADPEAWTEVVRLGALLYRRDALGVDGPSLLGALGEPPQVERLLLGLPVQPWDSRTWPEMAIDPGLLPKTPSAREWLGTMRRFGLIVHLVGPDHPETLAAERRVREAHERHFARLQQESPWVALLPKVAELEPEAAWDELHHRLLRTAEAQDGEAHQLVRALRAANVVAAMRQLDLHLVRPAPTIAGLAQAWAQGHDLHAAVVHLQRGPVAEFGLLLLALLHGNLYADAAARLPPPQGLDVQRRAATDRVAQVLADLLARRRRSRG